MGITDLSRRNFLRAIGLLAAYQAVAPGAALGQRLLKAGAENQGPAADASPISLQIRNNFLDTWRYFRNGFFFGPPITADRIENGIRVQYFRFARLEWQRLGEESEGVTMGLLGDELYGQRLIPDPTIPIEGKIRSFYDRVDGLRLFGLPISPALEEEADVVQYFQRAKFIFHPQRLREAYQEWGWGRSISWWEVNQYGYLVPGEVELTPLGEEVARRKGFWPEGQLIEFSPVPPAGPKRIVVDLTEQRLRAYEGDMVVMDLGVATGYGGSPTPQGDFSVLSKVPVMRYRGTRPDGHTYDLSGVPYNLMFLNSGIGYFIHGAYWHNLFGRLRYYGVSNGCVNVDPMDAGWIYDWAEVGTPVIVRHGAFSLML